MKYKKVYMIKKIPKNENRTFEQIKEHYQKEKKLAEILYNSDKNQRRKLYNSLYDELFNQILHHQQLTRKMDIDAKQKATLKVVGYLKYFLNNNSTFLEVGAGDCSLSLEISKFVKKVYAIEVSKEISKNYNLPNNFVLKISDGINIPVQKGIINVAFSNDVMEHLHPDDALEQLQNIYNCLVNGGKYFCITPNRLSGPHDISKYFDDVAKGFHLKEYTTSELVDLFKKVGFSNIKIFIGYKRFYLSLPAFLFISFERIINKLTLKIRKVLSDFLPIRFLLGIKIVATK